MLVRGADSVGEGGMRTRSILLALSAVALCVALPGLDARAGVIVEGRVTGCGMVLAGGRFEGTFVHQLDERGDALEVRLLRWGMSGGEPFVDLRNTITRRDRGLIWKYSSPDSVYYEATFAEAREAAKKFLPPDSAAWEWRVVAGESERIAGLDAVHYRCRHSAPTSGEASLPTTVHEAWAARPTPEVMRIVGDSWFMLGKAPLEPGGPRRGSGLPDDALVLRLESTMELPPELARDSAGQSAIPDSTELAMGIDRANNRWVLMRAEVTSIRKVDLPANALEPPPGRRRLVDPDVELLRLIQKSGGEERTPPGH